MKFEKKYAMFRYTMDIDEVARFCRMEEHLQIGNNGPQEEEIKASIP